MNVLFFSQHLTKIAASSFTNTPKPSELREKMKGVSLGKGKNGYCVYTHRARSNFYPSPEEIPESVIASIEKTGFVSKTALNALTKRLKFQINEAPGIKSLIVYPKKKSMLDQVGSLTVMNTNKNDSSVLTSYLHERLRGLGLGRKMYGRVAWSERMSGKQKLYSSVGGSTSQDAQNVYEALKRRGYPVVKGHNPTGPIYEIDLQQI